MTPTLLATSYESAVAYLLERIDYERMLSVPYRTREYKLDRMRELLARLGNPQDRLKIVHVGGTKGKGSTSAMIAGALSVAGLRTGLFTSPHLDRIEERLAIDGTACPPARLAELVGQLRGEVDVMDAAVAEGGEESGATFFELTTALALSHFASDNVDAAVLEVGMGGRLDSTNVCQPQLAVITSISLDHTQQLGDTEEEIAAEKAGIIKPGVAVVSGVTHPGAQRVIREVAAARGAPLVQLGVDFDFEYHSSASTADGQCAPSIDFRELRQRTFSPSSQLDGLKLAMLGRHQGANAAVAVAAIEQLRQQGWAIPDTALRRALEETRCRARVEVIRRRPTVVVDAAHNVASIAALQEVLAENFAARRRRLIFATSRDKDARGMLRLLLPAFDEVTLTRYQENPRGMAVEELDALAHELGSLRHHVCADPATAWHSVNSAANDDDLIVATGSFFIAAEVRRIVAGTTM